jgi:hypothetical protein
MKYLLLACAFYTIAAQAQNAGIGTTSPQNKLHIAAGLRVDTILEKKIIHH